MGIERQFELAEENIRLRKALKLIQDESEPENENILSYKIKFLGCREVARKAMENK